MRSVTSSFNRTLYHKNMTRFWPIWTVYTLIFSFAMPMQVLVQQSATQEKLMEYISDTLWRFARYQDEMLFLPFIFGVLIAMAVFSYLYSSRSACMVHALPISRKSLYFTNYISGLSMLLIPNLLILVLTLSAALCRGVWEPLPLLAWFVAQSCAGIFFFSFASFCAMFTGNIMALPAFYFVLNFLIVGMGALLIPLLSSVHYGFQDYSLPVQRGAQWLTPFWNMLESGITQSITHYDEATDRWISAGYQIVNLQVYAIYLVAGLIIALLGYLVYCRYETERAGDVVAEVRVHPLFRYGVGFCGGLAMGMLNVALLGLSSYDAPAIISFSILWGIVCYFVAEMLLQKSFKILKKAWKGAVVFGAVMALTFLSISLDVVGFEQSVPQGEDVKYVDARIGFYSDSFWGEINDPQMVEKVIALHQAIVETGEPDFVTSNESQTSTYITLYYTLTNGDTMVRSFDVVYYKQELDALGTVTQRASDLLNDDTFLALDSNMNIPTDAQVLDMSLDGYWNEEQNNEDYTSVPNPSDRDLILAAIRQDYAQGSWRDLYLFADDDYYQYRAGAYTARLEVGYYSKQEETEALVIESDTPIATAEYYGGNTNYIYLSLNSNCTHTINALYTIGLLDEKNYLVTDAQLDALYDLAT